MSDPTINVRIPQDLLEEYTIDFLESERKRLGIRNLSRNALIVRAMDEYYRKNRE